MEFFDGLLKDYLYGALIVLIPSMLVVAWLVWRAA
jgi:hypothetical protein